MLHRGAVLSACKSPAFSNSSPFKLRNPKGQISASGLGERESGALAKERRFQPALIVAPGKNVFDDQTPARRDVKLMNKERHATMFMKKS
jgi:hypothetical protein